MGLIVIASPYRGYPDRGLYTDVPYNLKKAEQIITGYWKRDIPALALVLQWGFLGDVPEDDYPTHDQALRWCRDIVARADELHLHYPASALVPSEGMLGEMRLAIKCGIPWKRMEWEEW